MNGTISIVKVFSGPTPEDKNSVVYIGREWGGWPASTLANHNHISDGNNEAAVQAYRKDLWEALKDENNAITISIKTLARKVKQGHNIKLGCWCAPKPCHGKVIRDCIEWMIKEGKV